MNQVGNDVFVGNCIKCTQEQGALDPTKPVFHLFAKWSPPPGSKPGPWENVILEVDHGGAVKFTPMADERLLCVAKSQIDPFPKSIFMMCNEIAKLRKEVDALRAENTVGRLQNIETAFGGLDRQGAKLSGALNKIVDLSNHLHQKLMSHETRLDVLAACAKSVQSIVCHVDRLAAVVSTVNNTLGDTLRRLAEIESSLLRPSSGVMSVIKKAIDA